jgi:hypothetical protein
MHFYSASYFVRIWKILRLVAIPNVKLIYTKFICHSFVNCNWLLKNNNNQQQHTTTLKSPARMSLEQFLTQKFQ